METVGDKYMLASGLPEKTHLHAKNIALVALDMIDIARDIVLEGDLHVKVSFVIIRELSFLPRGGPSVFLSCIYHIYIICS